jgi:hypothetical protein
MRRHGRNPEVPCCCIEAPPCHPVEDHTVAHGCIAVVNLFFCFCCCTETIRNDMQRMEFERAKRANAEL